MGKKALALLMILAILIGIGDTTYTQGKNLSRGQVEKAIEEISSKRGIPSVILKSIAKIESNYRQFDKNGNPLLGGGRYLGIMQIDSQSKVYNIEKLKYDPIYNIEAGADHLLGKWRVANNQMVRLGDMDPNILENWFFALWGYNGLLDRNDPNKSSRTYQDRIYEIALNDYNQKINMPDRKSIPSRGGFPRNNHRIETPKDYHEGDIIKYGPKDIVKPDTMEKVDGKVPLVLYDGAMGKALGRVKEDQTMTILEGPLLKRGFYFYKVRINEDGREGWVYGNWLALEEKYLEEEVEETEEGSSK